MGILQPFGKFFDVGFPQKFSGNSGTFELLVNMGKAALESLKATVGFSLVALTKQVFQLFVTQRIYFFKGESALLKELNVLLYRVARNVCLNGNRLFATPMIVKSQYLSYLFMLIVVWAIILGLFFPKNMVTATALKLTVTTGQFRPKYHGHFPPEQVVTLFRNQVVNISESSTMLLISTYN